jgi:hypothetical protein
MSFVSIKESNPVMNFQMLIKELNVPFFFNRIGMLLVKSRNRVSSVKE